MNVLLPSARLGRPNLVVVPCGGRKLPTPAPAGELYVGSYHRACHWAAAALAPERTLILSARHGLVDLDQVLAPYDTTFGDPEAVTAEVVAAQADRLGVRAVAGVVMLGGRRYLDATRIARPHVILPLVGTGFGQDGTGVRCRPHPTVSAAAARAARPPRSAGLR